MSSIIIAFPKKEIAQNIKRILAQSGYSVAAVCPTGAAALASMSQLDEGILVCGFRFVDMMYSELYAYMPESFQMLLVASAENVMERDVDNLICVSTPLKVHELLETIEMMEYQNSRRKKKKKRQPKERSDEERQIIEDAKRLLMNRNSFSEEEAHRYIQKRSMDNGTSLIETAQMVLSLMGDG